MKNTKFYIKNCNETKIKDLKIVYILPKKSCYKKFSKHAKSKRLKLTANKIHNTKP